MRTSLAPGFGPPFEGTPPQALRHLRRQAAGAFAVVYQEGEVVDTALHLEALELLVEGIAALVEGEGVIVDCLGELLPCPATPAVHLEKGDAEDHGEADEGGEKKGGGRHGAGRNLA
jgi:hypothetical protein